MFSMKPFRILLFIVLSFLVSCSEEETKNCEEHAVSSCNEDPTKVNIRILNQSDYDFCNVTLNPSGERTNYGFIAKGELSCYRSYDLAYDYAYLKLYIQNKEFIIQPIDYVGEEPLEIGYYTYKIDVVDFENRILSEEMGSDN